MSEAKTDSKELEQLRAQNEAMQKELEQARQEAEQAKARIREQSELLDRQVSRQEELVKRQLNAQRKVRIIIASGRDPHERCPVPVGVNGREYLIERDKQVDVPEGVLNVLALANAHVAETSSGQQVNTEFHQAPRFSYTVLGYVDSKTGEVAARG